MTFARGAASMQLCCRDQSGRTLNWRTCELTKIVATLAALGVPVTTEKVYRDLEGDERVTYLHGSVSLHPHRAALPPVKTLVQLYRSGKLQELDPLHPLLDGLRAIRNLHALRAWVEKQQPQDLASPTPGRALYESAAAPAHQSGLGVIHLRSIHRAAAFGLLGYPVVGIVSGSDGRDVWRIDQHSEFSPGVTAEDLYQQHTGGRLAADHPLVTAYDSAVTFDRLLVHIEDEIGMIMFRKRNTTMSTFLRQDAKDEAFKSSEDFLLGRS